MLEVVSLRLCLFEMYVSVVFVITLVRGQRLIRIIYYQCRH